VTTGKVIEQLAPHLPGFPLNPRDARFLGSPVDFVVFDGLEAGDVRRVVFVEIKTGGAALSGRERLVREAVRERRVEWIEWHPDGHSG
jgi:predicted Holliday junction resolvase-like endonuclease